MNTTATDWAELAAQLRTNAEVRAMAGPTITRHTLIRWRNREINPFPQPVLEIPSRAGTIELWAASEVDAWLNQQRP